MSSLSEATEALRLYQEAFKRAQESMRKWTDTIYNRYVYEAMLSICLPFDLSYVTRQMVGYNPQRLLSYQPSTVAIDNVRLSYPAIKRPTSCGKTDYLALELRTLLAYGMSVTVYENGKARVLTASELDRFITEDTTGFTINCDLYPGGEISGNRQMQMYVEAARYAPTIALQEKHKTTKQNGRSAAYLKHDHTKRNRGSHRGR